MKMKTIMARAGSLDNTSGRWSRFFTGAAACGNMDLGTKGVGSGVKAGARTVAKKDVGNHAAIIIERR
jgi:hydrogenase maturation factor